MMVTRHVKNQMPDNDGHAMVLGATRSASFAVEYSAPRSKRYMAPPGAAMPRFGSLEAKTGSAPMTRGMSNNRTMCDSVTDSITSRSACVTDSMMSMSSSSEDEEMFCTNESLTLSAPSQGSSVSSDVVRLTMSQ